MPHKDLEVRKKYSHKYRQEHQEEIKAYKREYYQNNKEKIHQYRRELYQQRRIEFMTNKSCSYCGITENLILHHADPTIKDPTLEDGSNGHIWMWCKSRRIKELQKCIVVCNPCHAIIHSEMRNGGK